MVKKKKHKTSAMRGLLVAIIVVMAAVGGVAYAVLGKSYSGPDAMLFIPSGLSSDQLADTLSMKAGKAGRYAAVMAKWRGVDAGRLRGAYMLKRGMSTLDIFKMITRHRQTPVNLTFNNIRTLDQLSERVASSLDISATDFRAAVDSMLDTVPVAERIGHFMPDTYEFFWTATPERVVKTLAGHYDSFWNDKRTARAKAFGLSPIQLVTIASIAEEETNDPIERGIIGRLYINRLHRNMPLQACPTVKFALGDFSLRRITNAHISTPSPYNTYINPGLPPGPIRMPSAATIDSILNAPANNYLYMCAKEDFSGRHNFTDSYAVHQANAARYHRALNARKIK